MRSVKKLIGRVLRRIGKQGKVSAKAGRLRRRLPERQAAARRTVSVADLCWTAIVTER